MPTEAEIRGLKDIKVGDKIITKKGNIFICVKPIDCTLPDIFGFCVNLPLTETPVYINPNNIKTIIPARYGKSHNGEDKPFDIEKTRGKIGIEINKYVGWIERNKGLLEQIQKVVAFQQVVERILKLVSPTLPAITEDEVQCFKELLDIDDLPSTRGKKLGECVPILQSLLTKLEGMRGEK
jgi:hypothetical protein